MNEQRQEPKFSHKILGAAMNPLQASHGEPHVYLNEWTESEKLIKHY